MKPIPCRCDSQYPAQECCAPLLSKKKIAQTPEQLMRSRYSAYATGQIDYISATMLEAALEGFNADDARAWTEKVKWLGLTVHDSALSDVNHGTVTFEATYIEDDHLCTLKECSQFKRINEHWYYIDGDNAYHSKKIGLNQACPCGSRKKYKRCCR